MLILSIPPFTQNLVFLRKMHLNAVKKTPGINVSQLEKK